MRIRIDNFKGMAPRVQARQLPAGFAQKATNLVLAEATLRPLRESETVYTFAADTAMFMRHNDAWYGWDNANVCAVPGPVAQDRIYITGDGAPQLRSSGAFYPLALPAPVEAPSVEFTNRPADPEPNDPADAIPDLPATGGVRPAALLIVREPVGSISGEVMLTQPAIAVVDAAGLLCENHAEVVVTVAISSGTLGYIGGTRTLTITNGIGRFTDLEFSGDPETDYRLSFTAEDVTAEALAEVEPEAEDLEDVVFDEVESEIINVTTNYSDLISSVLYAYTYVTSLGEESAPSALSEALDWYPGLIVQLGNFAAAPSGRLITKMRIYRTVTSAAGVTDLYFVDEINATALTYDHDIEEKPIVEVLPSADFDTPPDDMEGIIALPNGIMAAFTGRELLFSEPYKPHAWPTKYRLTTDYDIVGLGAFGSSIAVLTEGTPYIVTGSTPESMVMQRLEVNLPCVSRRGIVDLGYTIAYPSVDGLVTIGTNGATIATRQILTRDQWRAMQPETFIAEPYAGLYVASRAIAGGGGTRALEIFDLTGEAPYQLSTDQDVRALHADIETGTLYVIEADNARQVRAWDAGDPETFEWRSGIARTGAPVNFGAALISAKGGAETASGVIYADGVQVGTIPSKNLPCRLPSGFLASEWEIELTGTAEVFAVAIASTMEELTND